MKRIKLKSVFTRISSMFLVLCIISCCTIGVYATGLTGLVIGGSIAESGLLEAAVNALIIALGADGATSALRSYAESTGSSVRSVVSGWLSGYAISEGLTVDNVAKTIVQSIGYTSSGLISVGKNALGVIDGLCSYVDAQNITYSSSSAVGDLTNSDGTINLGYCYPDTLYVRNGNNYYFYSSSYSYNNGHGVISYPCVLPQVPCYVTLYDKSYYVFVDAGVDVVRIGYTDGFHSGVDGIVGRFQYYKSTPYSTAVNINVPVSTSDPLAGLDDLVSSSEQSLTIDNSVLSPADDEEQSIVLDPTGILSNIADIIDGAVADIGDYVGTIADAIAGVADIALPLTEPVGAVPLDVPTPAAAAVSVPVVPAADIADEDIEPADEDMQDLDDAGTVDLTDFFPFCIPFDIYKMLDLLDADPVAPNFDWSFPDGSGNTVEYHVDLSDFDNIASILRKGELLLGCIGLAILTKNLIQGGS